MLTSCGQLVMAVDLTPRFRRLNSQTRSFRENIQNVVQNHELTRPQSETLVLFLMDNCTELFRTPTSLIEAVRRTLRTMQQGIDPDSIATFTFCQQVTPQEYEDQREATTLESLKRLLRHISSSETIPVKQRRRLLKEFEKHHPVVFLQHLSSTF